jgi:hypothetical protein
MLKIVSPTGCVHAVDLDYSNTGNGNVTLCSHANYHRSYGEQYYHMWKKTVKDVTCKRCLVVLNKKIEHKETDWTKSRRNCEHRYPHLKHGVLCNESTTSPRSSVKFGAEVAMRKCVSKLCPIPPIKTQYVHSAAAMVSDLVCNTIINISKDLLHADKSFKLRFDMIAVHCQWKKPDKSDYSQCTNPDRQRPTRFGFHCGIKGCPYMNDAVNWRAGKYT